jgi:hypothetical protein
MSKVFSVGQPVVFQFKSLPLALITIKDIEVTDINAIKGGKESKPFKAQVQFLHQLFMVYPRHVNWRPE